MPGVIIDIGAGDGGFAKKLAEEYPDRYIIGIDPNHQGLEKVSQRSQVGSKRDKLANLLYVLDSVEDLPTELNGAANQVFINFPWAGLMQKLLLADGVVWRNIARICQTGALVEVVFSYDPTHDARLELPLVDQSYIDSELTPKLRQLGFEVTNFSQLSSDDLKNYPSSWGKRLAFGRARSFYHLQVKKSDTN